MKVIDFYFDFSSPYGYFMSEKIGATAKRYGRSVHWHPVLLFAVLRSVGLPPPFEHPIKLEYITKDFARSAKQSGIEYALPPTFPASTQNAARAFYLLNEKAPQSAIAFAQSVLRKFFCDGLDISSLELISQIVCSQTDALGDLVGVSDLLKTQAAKSLLQNAIAQAVDKKVFGSPFVIIDGEPFFGFDRLMHIEQKLASS